MALTRHDSDSGQFGLSDAEKCLACVSWGGRGGIWRELGEEMDGGEKVGGVLKGDRWGWWMGMVEGEEGEEEEDGFVVIMFGIKRKNLEVFFFLFLKKQIDDRCWKSRYLGRCSIVCNHKEPTSREFFPKHQTYPETRPAVGRGGGYR